MKSSIKAAVGAAVLAGTALAPVAVSTSADASPARISRGECSWYAGCGGIQHYAPDDGYDPAFLVRCNYGDPTSNRWVPEGHNGNEVCKDVDEVQVGSGQQIVCMTTYGWQVRYDATGWHKIYDGQNPLCVMQLD